MLLIEKDYRKNSSVYDDYIFGWNSGFYKRFNGSAIIKKIEDAEPFPLVRLNIDRNKKSIL
ncbi:MAG: hypothetical protein L6U99_13540 [Clostridium sp.]|nr:MAG: hypothetical protein L6U99_13540 [Clostridium sp.]